MVPNIDFPGRLGAIKTKRNSHLRLIEIEQEPGRGGRTERAKGSGRVKATLIVRAHHQGADKPSRLIACDESTQHVHSRTAFRFGDR